MSDEAGFRAKRKDFEAAREKALKCGAAGFHVDDLKREFVEELIFRKSLLDTRLLLLIISRRSV